MPTSDWTPDVPRVGAILRARTVDTSGTELGTFSSDTRPTTPEVVSLIGNAVDDVSSVIGADIPQAAWDTAAAVSALGAALYVELSYFPEQINNGASPYPQLKVMYDQRLAQLIKLVQSEGGDTIGVEPGTPLAPVYSFPVYPVYNAQNYDPRAIGRYTRW